MTRTGHTCRQCTPGTGNGQSCSHHISCHRRMGNSGISRSGSRRVRWIPSGHMRRQCSWGIRRTPVGIHRTDLPRTPVYRGRIRTPGHIPPSSSRPGHTGSTGSWGSHRIRLRTGHTVSRRTRLCIHTDRSPDRTPYCSPPHLIHCSHRVNTGDQSVLWNSCCKIAPCTPVCRDIPQSGVGRHCRPCPAGDSHMVYSRGTRCTRTSIPYSLVPGSWVCRSSSRSPPHTSRYGTCRHTCRVRRRSSLPAVD